MIHTGDKYTVSDKVYHHLIYNILSGRWKVGDKITSENDLAEALGVSRNSVRTAIGRLIALDVLESRRGGGTFVRSTDSAGMYLSSIMPALLLSENALPEILEFRRIIEVETARLAAVRADEADIAALEDNLALMRSTEYDQETFSRLDMQFHEIIAGAARNALLIRVFGIVRDVLIASQVFVQRTVGPQYTFIYHPRIIDAIKKRDAELAAQIMTEHIDVTVEQAMLHIGSGAGFQDNQSK